VVQRHGSQLVDHVGRQVLRSHTDGTRWTNRQLLFHMVFGYIIVRTLMPPVRVLGRLGWSRRFAKTLNALYRPFHVINYLGSCVGGQLLSPRRMAALMDATITAIQRRLAAEIVDGLAAFHLPDGSYRLKNEYRYLIARA
jgi:hypothetical protein